MYDKIRWACLQPLTGGMYLGAEAAIGHPAEFIISYPGFDAVKLNKEGRVTYAANEHHLKKYLIDHGRMPAYYTFDRRPFDSSNEMPTHYLKDGEQVDAIPEMHDIDIVCSVPVCAGLSGATSNASQERKDERNCNMVWLAKYALQVIRPKVYVFENAPRLVSEAGSSVRDELNTIALQAGYSVAYYKTDTKWHDNCQKRPRTFVYFIKWGEDHMPQLPPEIGYEHQPRTIQEVLSRIPKDATQQETLKMSNLQQATFDYVISEYGKDWRSKMKTKSMIESIIKDDRLDDFNAWAQSHIENERIRKQVDKYVKHIQAKALDNKGFYQCSPTFSTTTMPAAMFKTMPNCLHYAEDRLYTIREWLHVMGMPDDFDMQGDLSKVFMLIGQNVPARTAQFIMQEAARIVDTFGEQARTVGHGNISLFDNNKMQKVW